MDSVANPPAEAREQKHTPGPWEWHEFTLPNGEIETRITFEDGRPLGVVDRWANWQANARLIAAAPKLLEACEQLVEQLHYCPDNPARKMGEAALAAAKGGGG